MAKREPMRHFDPHRALDARPVLTEIKQRRDLSDGGARFTFVMQSSRWMRRIFRIPERVEKNYEFDAVGVSVIELCDGDRSVRHIVKKTAQQLELEEYEATQAVLQFVRLLHRRKIVALMAKPTD